MQEQTVAHCWVLALTLTCNQETVLLVHTSSGSKPTVTIGESSNQTQKKHWYGWVTGHGHKDTWLQLPGAAHRSTTRFTPTGKTGKGDIFHQIAIVCCGLLQLQHTAREGEQAGKSS